MMSIFLAFGIIMFMMIVYLLSKIIIEKNAQSISMAKILGYRNREINQLYIVPTAIVVILSMFITVPVSNWAIGYICNYFFKEYPMYSGIVSITAHNTATESAITQKNFPSAKRV